MSMPLRAGYKQTEVGVIPEDWDVRQLKKISASQSVGLVINPSTYVVSNGTVPMLVGSNIKENSIDWQHARRISDASNKLIPASQLNAGDLVTVRVGEPGITAVVPMELDGCNCASVMIIRKHKNFNSHWLCYVMNSPAGIAQVENVQYGTAQKQFNISDAINFTYATPPLSEQEAIAEALSDADALIESLELLTTKKRNLKQGAMQGLLTGRTRLPGFQVKLGYKRTEAGTIPEDWEVVSMGQVSKCLIGLTYSPRDVRDSGTLVLRSSNVQNGKLAFYDNVFVKMDIPARAITQKDDILVCVRNGSRQLIGKCALIDSVTSGSAFGAFMSVLRSNSAKFLFFQFQSIFLKSQIDEVMGATINQITNKDLATFKVIWPSNIAEQTAIATVLSEMDAEITELETQLAKARAIKQGMMNNLLTGKIRLI